MTVDDRNEAVEVAPGTPEGLRIRPVPLPEPTRRDALVRVAAVSLNRGETWRALNIAPAGWTPGWDLAGTVAVAAADGSGPAVGERVVGIVAEGSWARYVAVPGDALARLPDAVPFAQAATLPVAGLTAYHALRQGGLLLGDAVLITGVTGGVGNFALQLARAAGAARRTAVVRDGGRVDVERLRRAGATDVSSGLRFDHDPELRFDLVVDGVGGPFLAQALSRLAPAGTCVSYGSSSGSPMTLDGRQFYSAPGSRVYGLVLFDELHGAGTAAAGLRRLVHLLAAGRLVPEISVQQSWRSVGAVARALIERSFAGKAVLTID